LVYHLLPCEVVEINKKQINKSLNKCEVPTISEEESPDDGLWYNVESLVY